MRCSWLVITALCFWKELCFCNVAAITCVIGWIGKKISIIFPFSFFLVCFYLPCSLSQETAMAGRQSCICSFWFQIPLCSSANLSITHDRGLVLPFFLLKISEKAMNTNFSLSLDPTGIWNRVYRISSWRLNYSTTHPHRNQIFKILFRHFSIYLALLCTVESK